MKLGYTTLNSDSSSMLKNSPIFSSLTDKELYELASLFSERKAVANEIIFWEGDPSERFYIVARGQVKVTKLSSLGKEMIIAFFGSGEMFGEVAVFEDKPYPASAQAVSDAVLLGIRKTDFINFLLKHPGITLKIISILSGRLRDAQNRLRDLAGERVEQRLARMLLMLSAKIGTTLPFTRQDISDMAGTTTETTIRTFSQWKDHGIIRSLRGKIIIVDETKLKIMAEGPPRLS
jgi:CRP-like cAMP-binding protein